MRSRAKCQQQAMGSPKRQIKYAPHRQTTNPHTQITCILLPQRHHRRLHARPHTVFPSTTYHRHIPLFQSVRNTSLPSDTCSDAQPICYTPVLTIRSWAYTQWGREQLPRALALPCTFWLIKCLPRRSEPIRAPRYVLYPIRFKYACTVQLLYNIYADYIISARWRQRQSWICTVKLVIRYMLYWRQYRLYMPLFYRKMWNTVTCLKSSTAMW